MRPTEMQLVMRDPAKAALLGIIPGADFGAEFGDDDDDYGVEGDFGDDDDWGAEFGAAAAIAKAQPPNAAKLAAMWKQLQVAKSAQARRTRLLNPNRGSSTKVEKYILALSDDVVIGTPQALNLLGQPDCTFRPQRMTITIPTPSFYLVDDIKMANVSVNIGPGMIDAFQFNANGVGQRMDMPTLTPANRARITGNYTGFAGGFPEDSSFVISATFIGPSSLAGGAGSY